MTSFKDVPFPPPKGFELGAFTNVKLNEGIGQNKLICVTSFMDVVPLPPLEYFAR